MTTVTISMQRLGLDGSLHKQTMDFLDKLAADPTSPGLHVEPVQASVDPRVRTGRVNKQYRAVMFEMTGPDMHHFVIVGVYNHDDAYAKATGIRLEVNPINGITRLIEETAPAKPSAQDRADRQKAEAAAREAAELSAQQAQEEAASVKEVEAPGAALLREGYTADVLEQELGVDPTVTTTVLALADETGLEAALSSSPAWERDALLGLIAGLSLEEVRESLGIVLAQDDEEGTERSEDERIVAGLKTPAAQMEFAYLDEVNTEELRKVIDSDNFDAWRVFLHPDQQEIVERNHSGSARVFGGAGTGKTVVAVHRANRLVTSDGATPELQDAPPAVLLTTFTRGLADSLKSLMNALNPAFPEAGVPGESGLWIGGIDSVIYQVLSKAPSSQIEKASEQVLGRATKRIKPFTGDEEKQYWLDALMNFRDVDLPPELGNTTFMEQEFESVVLANQITTQAAYLRVPRPGRGTPLNRGQRKKVWPVIEAFMNASARDGKVSWPAQAAVAARLLDNREGTLFDHVIIDEAQDFHAGHWRFLRACVAPGPNDIFLAEDSHQRIYGQHYVLSHFGIATRGRASKRLTVNYRTTRENLGYALQVLDSEKEWLDAEGEEDSEKGYRSLRSGPRPQRLSFATEDEEFDAVAELIRQWQDNHPDPRIGVLTRTRPLINRVVNALADNGITAVKTKNAELASHENVSVMTMHGAKGMEFTHVILLGMGDDVLPLQHQLTGLGKGEREDALQRERALLYVAATRARDELVVTTHGTPSRLLPT